jgi:dephospho-CoA kinase
VLVGIHGKAGSGKDTLAAILIDELRKQGVHAVRRGFGDYVKEEYMEMVGVTLEEIERDKPKHRAALQDLGNGRRETDPEYWIRMLLADRPCNEVTVIPDVRYLNEYDICNEGVILRVRAPLEVRQARREVVNDDHISETALDHFESHDFDETFWNTHTIEQFQETVRRWVQENVWLFIR